MHGVTDRKRTPCTVDRLPRENCSKIPHIWDNIVANGPFNAGKIEDTPAILCGCGAGRVRMVSLFVPTSGGVQDGVTSTMAGAIENSIGGGGGGGPGKGVHGPAPL